MTKDSQLAIPNVAKNDLQVWTAAENQHMSIRVGVWDDLGAWGILLADLARQIVSAHAQDQQIDISAALARIKAAIDAELASPSDPYLNL